MKKSELNKNLLKSIKNINGIKTVASDLINTYDILNSNQLLITLDAVKSIEEIWDVNNKPQGGNDES